MARRSSGKGRTKEKDTNGEETTTEDAVIDALRKGFDAGVRAAQGLASEPPDDAEPADEDDESTDDDEE